jgi:hypothetical protein
VEWRWIRIDGAVVSDGNVTRAQANDDGGA